MLRKSITRSSRLKWIPVILSVLLVIWVFSDQENTTAANKAEAFWYRYPVLSVDRVYDGDTFWLTWSAGFDQNMVKVKCRLLGSDAIEKRDLGGDVATLFTQEFLSTGTLVVWTHGKRGNFGRVLVDIEKLETGKWLSRELQAVKLVKKDSQYNKQNHRPHISYLN